VRIIHGKGKGSGPRGPVLKVAVNMILRKTEPVLAFTRSHAGTTVFVALNLGAAPVTLPLPPGTTLQQIECPGPRNGHVDRAGVSLPAHAVVYATAAHA